MNKNKDGNNTTNKLAAKESEQVKQRPKRMKKIATIPEDTDNDANEPEQKKKRGYKRAHQQNVQSKSHATTATGMNENKTMS